MIVTVSDDTFEELVLRAELPVLLDFTADWCPPCKMIKPVLRELADELAGRLVVAELDVDVNPRTAQAAGVLGMPHAQPLRGRAGGHAGRRGAAQGGAAARDRRPPPGHGGLSPPASAIPSRPLAGGRYRP